MNEHSWYIRARAMMAACEWFRMTFGNEEQEDFGPWLKLMFEVDSYQRVLPADAFDVIYLPVFKAALDILRLRYPLGK